VIASRLNDPIDKPNLNRYKTGDRENQGAVPKDQEIDEQRSFKGDPMNNSHGKQRKKPLGLTKDVGFQVGVRQTLPISLEDAWQLITSKRGVKIWLGDVSKIKFTMGATYQLPDDTIGEIRVCTPHSHLRVTWHPPGWRRSSTIQLRVIPQGDRTTFAFHQEHLPGPTEREERRLFYTGVIENLKRIIQSET
jgi:uncharacterized protein YndB with AHSA1/START domain